MSKRPIQVSFIGSGDALGSGGRFQACILLQAPGHDGDDVLLDCGASSLVALKQQHHDPNQIGLVLLSHLHGDHFGGLPFLVLDGQFAHRTRPLHVAGPAGVRERVQAAMEVLFPGSTGVQRRFALHCPRGSRRAAACAACRAASGARSCPGCGRGPPR